MTGPATGEPTAPFDEHLVLTNPDSKIALAQIQLSVQSDPSLFSDAPPDPVYGSDRALGKKSWTEENGNVIEQGSLTDGKDWTSAGTDWGSHTEAFQYVDLAKPMTVTKMTFLSGDANWINKVDISSSLDGETYTPLPGLQELDWYHKWGPNTISLSAPFTARFIRLRYHDDGNVVKALRFPASLSVYAGTAGDSFDVPAIGQTIDTRSQSVTIAPGASVSISIGNGAPLSPGSYFVAAKVVSNGTPQLLYAHYFVMPPALPQRSLAAWSSSRFGLNTADVKYAPINRRLGVGWVRFENMKWPMVSAQTGDYHFDGTIAPWNVNEDAIFDGYADQNINVLPYLFLTPRYQSSAPTTVAGSRWLCYPPKNNAQYGDFVYQTVARYGTTSHPATDLETPDKLSGKNKVHVFELWNEPNLSSPDWGSWVGTIDQYFDMMRAGCDALHRADPTALVLNGGFSGEDADTVAPLATYHYPDGKRPIDLIDALNVHFYSGQIAPEVASVGLNGLGSHEGGARTVEDDLHNLVAWRDANKPGLPIWMTETGYDSAGDFGTTERVEAARLPRDVMMVLAAGIDKVFVYRETGSTPSKHACSGVMRNDGTLKPSWFTYATLIRQLDHATSARRLAYSDPNVRLYAWKRGPETILTAWTVEGTADVPLPLGKCTVTDAFGHSITATIKSELPLSIFPVYVTNITNGKALDTFGK